MMGIALRRVLWLLPILFGVSVLTFVLVRMLPGDYAQVVAGVGSDISPEILDNIRRAHGLDRPMLVQYGEWLVGVFRGDFGVSLMSGKPVLAEMLDRLGVTIQLTAMAALLAFVFGSVTGLLSGIKGGVWELIVRAGNAIGIAVPNFVIATLIVLFAGLYFPWASIFGYTPLGVDPIGHFTSLLLPAFALSVSMSVVISENFSAAVREVEKQDYMMVATAKGLSRRTIVRSYQIKNALTPVVTVTGLQFAGLLGGSIVVETIFAIPGMGQLLFDSVTGRDYPVLQGVVLVAATMVIVVNLIVDLVYIKLDSRVKSAH